MADIRIYGPVISTFVRIVEITAEEKGVTWENIPSVTRSEEHRQRHPFLRSPAVEVSGMRLFETDAITRYIDEAFEGPPLQPDMPGQRAEMQKWMSVMQHYVFPTTEVGLIVPRVLAPLQGLPVDENAVAKALPAIRYQLGVIDAHLSTSAFFAGNRPSLADFYHQVSWWSVFSTSEGRQLISESPHVTRWLAFMMSRPSAVATAWPDESAGLDVLRSLSG